MGEAPQPSSSSPWGLPAAVLVLACLLNLPAALSSKHVDPPRNDLLLHGQMVDRAASTLQDFGWTAFQDPWFPELNGGYPLFHHYPHLPHQVTAAAAVVLGADPWRLLGSTSVLLVFLLPLGTWLGGRMLGLSSEAAALAALVVATTRSLDGFGHAPLAYGTEGLGLYGQLWGMGLAALAGPAWLAASLPGGAGLKRMRPLLRCLLAAALVSLVLRSSLPAGWVLGLCAAVATAVAGPRGELGTRAARFAAVGLGAAVLSLGFLAPFVADLGATHTTALDMLPEERRSVGALVVLQRLTLGHYLDGGPLGPWSPLLLAAGAGLLLARLRGQPAPPILEGLGLATAAAVLLLFGRATWGDWVDGLPLVGRFHDHRYLLGLQLLAPWVIGGALAALLATLRSRGRGRTARVLLVGVLLLATAGQLRGVQDARQAWAERGVLTESPQRQELLRRASAAGSARLALTRPEPLLDGTTELSWLRRAGFPTFGRPLYHYSHIFDFALYWTRWIDGRLGPRGRPIDSRDLLVAGVGELLDLPGGGQLGSSSAGVAAVVRSDLLVLTGGTALEGFEIHWFQQGIHLSGQHPTLDVGVGARPDPDGYQRVTALADRDASALVGLPDGTDVGQVTRSQPGERPGDLLIEASAREAGAWLLVTSSWHPGWQALLDGKPVDVAMLAPGWLGVRLPLGEHRVALSWRPAGWLGAWAAANAACYLALVGVLLGRLRRRTRP